MPKMNIKKSIHINTPIEKVYKTVSDFHSWVNWSPWLIAEPEAKVDVRKDGKYYSWEGNRIGSGNMNMLKETPPHMIDCDLTFLKPWKSKAKVHFVCQEENGGTNVSWTMNSSLPFFMFWMKKSMEAFVGSDYERGLNMLKEYIEQGKIDSKLEFQGESNFAGFNYIGIRTETTMEKLGPDMSSDLQKLWKIIEDQQENLNGESFSIYHKFDMVKKRVAYTSGIPVKTIPENLPAGILTGNIPATKVYTLRHIGSYKHLGNAWTTMYSMHRNKEIKLVKGIHPFESYVNIPGEVPDGELITDIRFAIK